MEITGKTKILGIIADPVMQVRTPDRVNALLAQHEKFRDYVLIPMHVSAEQLANFIHGLRAMQNFAGAVITMPHKTSIVNILDELTPTAQSVNAVNVIHYKNGKLKGHLLDGEGFVKGLLIKGHHITGCHCIMRGAGGAASAIAFALANHGCQSLTIQNRTIEKAIHLKHQLNQIFPEFTVKVEDHDACPHQKADFDIAINASSLGMQPHDRLPFSPDIIQQCKLVAECIIAPEQTALLKVAQRFSINTHSGMHMLNSQLQLMLEFMTEGLSS